VTSAALWTSVLAAGDATAWWIFAVPPGVMTALLAIIYFLARAAPAEAPDAETETDATARLEARPAAAASPEPLRESKPLPSPKLEAKPAPAPEPKPLPSPKLEAKPAPAPEPKPLPSPKLEAKPAPAPAPPREAEAKIEPLPLPLPKIELKPAPKALPLPKVELKAPAKQAPLPAGSAAPPAEIAEPKAKPSAVTVAAALARPEAAPAPLAAAEPAKKKKSLFEGLGLTRGGFVAKLETLFRGRKEVDKALLDQIEEVMFTADLGVKTCERLLTELKARLSRAELKDPRAVWDFLKSESRRILALDAAAWDVARAKPFVVMVVGVNGVGKTTTIGKLGARLADEGRKVLLAAGDTFRAAATEQLEIWGKRAGMPVVKGAENADPASVVFEALKRAQTEGADVVLCDTAGRLHTKVPLMDEMAKVKRVMAKAIPGAPHEVVLVLDATTGQNAISQARMFTTQLEVSGLILTKLDGTAKGGVILGICDELKIPVRFIGIGEQADDLRTFHAADFVDALFATDAADAGNP
jgi:fused signal recognition particle receptor